MSQCEDNLLAFLVIYRSPLLTIREYCCRAARGGPLGEEQADEDGIVFLRRGSFCKHVGRTAVVADVNQVAFFSRDCTYRVSHPTDCGDQGLVVSLARAGLREILARHDVSATDQLDISFPFLTGPCDNSIFRRHLALWQSLKTADIADPSRLSVEVAAGELAQAAIDAAFARSERAIPRQTSRVRTSRRERIEAAKSWMSAHLNRNIGLAELAQVAELSPFYFARLFRETTGLSPHRYQVLLRLRIARLRIDQGASNLSHLALELGFSSHSHLTDSFRREFGIAPSQLRAACCDRRSQPK